MTIGHERAATADRLSLARAAHHAKPEQLKQILKDLKTPWL